MFKRCLLALTLTSMVYVGGLTVAAQDSDKQSSANNDQKTQAEGEYGHGGRHFDPSQRAQMMAQHLNLNSDQQSKIEEILKSEQSQMQSLRADSSMSPQDRRSKMMDIHKTSNDQIRALLNPDQQKKWDEMQAGWQQRMHEHRRGGQGPDSPPQPQ
jgi:Spy/CpxP family protein refolding chaperone